MADNYLEKQMEDFRAGKTTPRRSTGAMSRPSRLSPQTIAMPKMRILVACSDSTVTEATVRLMRSTGARVAFIAPPGKQWQQLAQDSGARFYPVEMPDNGIGINQNQADAIMADLRRHWFGIDMITGDIAPFVTI